MPFYNTPQDFLNEAIRSVFDQTYRDWELLLVDDGSAEPLASVAKRYTSGSDSRVSYLHHPGRENRGLSASRNLGIGHAKGRYIAFLDADDLWLPKKLDQQVALMEAHPDAGMLYGNTLYWFTWTRGASHERRDHVPHLGFAHLTLMPPPRLLPLFLEGRVAVPCTCSILVRRSIVQQVSGFVESVRGLYEDQLFYAKMCLRAPILVSTNCWDLYRQHGGSLCGRASDAQLREARIRFLDWLESYLREHDFDSEPVWRALRREQWRIRYPALARLGRTAQRLARHARNVHPSSGSLP